MRRLVQACSWCICEEADAHAGVACVKVLGSLNGYVPALNGQLTPELMVLVGPTSSHVSIVCAAARTL